MYNLPIDPVRSKYNACTGCTVTAIKSYIIKCVSAVAFVTLHIHGIFRYFFVWCYGTNLFEKNQELERSASETYIMFALNKNIT